MKAKMIILIIAGFLVLAVSSVHQQRTLASEASLDLDFIEAALKHQESANLEVKYCSTSAANRGTMVYTRTPEVQLWTQEGQSGEGETVRTSYDIASTECRVHYANNKTGENRGVMGTSLFGPLSQQDLIETARYPLYAGKNGTVTLREWIKFGNLREIREKVDGHLCWRIDIVAPISTVAQYSVWLDPEIGFCPRRVSIEQTTEGPFLTNFRDYVSIGEDLWFPRELSVDVKNSDGTTSTLDYRVVELLARDRIPKNELLVSFPSGTAVNPVGTFATVAQP